MSTIDRVSSWVQQHWSAHWSAEIILDLPDISDCSRLDGNTGHTVISLQASSRKTQTSLADMVRSLLTLVLSVNQEDFQAV